MASLKMQTFKVNNFSQTLTTKVKMKFPAHFMKPAIPCKILKEKKKSGKDTSEKETVIQYP